MKLTKLISKKAYGVKLSFQDGNKEIGRVFLYILYNNLHKRPFGLIEDVFVNENYRNLGLGSKLVTAVIAEAKKRRCYKVIATSRSSKPELKKFYKRFGLEVWGVEYRIDFK